MMPAEKFLSLSETKKLINEAKEHFKIYVIDGAPPKDKYQALRAFVYGYFSAKGIIVIDPSIAQRKFKMIGRNGDA